MAKLRKVYIVESDDYPEDRFILGVYSSKEIAEKAIENYKNVTA